MGSTVHALRDFDGLQLSARQGEDKIDLGPVGRAIVARLGSVRRDGNQRFGDEAFPRLPDDRMTEQSFLVSYAAVRFGALGSRS
jgi:hypothetical protein